MILTVGEILVDLFGRREDDRMVFTAAAGGAPFNAAVAAKRDGAQTAFIGAVGDDVPGRFLGEFAETMGFDYLSLRVDAVRPTTLAFVALENGERSFSFFRRDTADSHIGAVNFSEFKNLNIVHLGTLMLSEAHGREFARNLIESARQRKLTVAADLNFRASLFRDEYAMLDAFSDVLEGCDVLKLSDDEALLVTGASSLDAALEQLAKRYRDKLIAVTAGARGSYCVRNGSVACYPSDDNVVPVDTTGAGDAFFGTLLARLDRFGASDGGGVAEAFRAANRAGAAATQRMGAI